MPISVFDFDAGPHSHGYRSSSINLLIICAISDAESCVSVVS